MKTTPALILLAIAAIIMTSAMPSTSQAQRAPIGAAAAEDMPHRTARTFAPFIRALITRHFNTAQSIFKIRRSVETSLETIESERILGRFNKPDRLELNLVGGRTLGNNIGILLFTIATEDGPIAFKVYYYGFGNDLNINRVELADDWDQIEALGTNMEMLSIAIPVPLGATDAGQ